MTAKSRERKEETEEHDNLMRKCITRVTAAIGTIVMSTRGLLYHEYRS